MRFSTVAAFVAAAFLVAAPASAQDLPSPTGEVILTVSGAIQNTNSGDTAVFDLEMLKALEQGEIVTSTPWYEGPRTFTGPLGSAFIEAVGATGTMMRFTAINDFVSEIPVEDFTDLHVVMATEIDGEVISVRDRGPIFVMYPFDDNPELKNRTYQARAVWQVKTIEIY